MSELFYLHNMKYLYSCNIYIIIVDIGVRNGVILFSLNKKQFVKINITHSEVLNLKNFVYEKKKKKKKKQKKKQKKKKRGRFTQNERA